MIVEVTFGTGSSKGQQPCVRMGVIKHSNPHPIGISLNLQRSLYVKIGPRGVRNEPILTEIHI